MCVGEKDDDDDRDDDDDGDGDGDGDGDDVLKLGRSEASADERGHERS